MVIEFEEIYEVKSAKTELPMGKHLNTKRYASRSIYINPEYVVCVRGDLNISTFIRESNSDIKADAFTRVYMHRGQTGIDVIVAGNAIAIEQKLGGGRSVLKG